MAVYNNLPVYKVSYDLFLKVFQLVTNFNREYKYSLGESIKKEMLSLLTNIYKANCAYKKNDYISEARENVEVMRLFIRLTKDLQQINLTIYIDVNKNIETISKQLTAWGKYSDKYG